jgi:hypothetical protein
VGKFLGKVDITVDGEVVAEANVEASGDNQIVRIDGEEVGADALYNTGFQIGEVSTEEGDQS